MAKKIFTRKPRTVRIGKARYSIELVESPNFQDNLLGVIIFDDRVIEIKKDMTREQIDATILHEIMHAVSHHYGVRMSEKTVLTMEKALVELFSNNRWKISV